MHETCRTWKKVSTERKQLRILDIMKIIYITPKGIAIPCSVTKTKIVPLVNGGYKILRLLGFPTKRKTKCIKY